MSPILIYFAKVLLISGLLFGYYRLFLRNASFHGYNRVFLLGIVALSLVLPFIPLPAGDLLGGTAHPTAATSLLHRIGTGNWEESVAGTRQPTLLQAFLSRQILFSGACLIITLVFLTTLGLSIRHILRLAARCPELQAADIRGAEQTRIFLTDEPGTPFSFFRCIFWNRGLDIKSSTGRQIFRHELYHVRQKHSADLLAIGIIRAICWWNPFFHLIRRELKATHEFLADRYAIETSDRFEYAELLVWQSIGRSPSPLVHSFFNTHLKRRITMLTRSTNTRHGYFNRIMVLPLLLLLFCAFAGRIKKQGRAAHPLSATPVTLVIDAGHGGSDPGTHSATLNEKDINLAIAKKVQQLAASYNINVLMTREEDKIPGNKSGRSDGLDYRADFANEHKADLFISIHVNSGDVKGMEVWLSSQNPFYQKSVSLGSAMVEEMKKVYPTNEELKQRKESIRVLEKTKMPAILVECGSMSDEKDLAFITDEQNQTAVARGILQGVLRYEQGLVAAPAN